MSQNEPDNTMRKVSWIFPSQWQVMSISWRKPQVSTVFLLLFNATLWLLKFSVEITEELLKLFKMGNSAGAIKHGHRGRFSMLITLNEDFWVKTICWKLKFVIQQYFCSIYIYQ